MGKTTKASVESRAELLRAIPYAQTLGLVLVAESPQLIVKMPFSEALVGNPSLPALHGGTLGTLLETTCIVQLYPTSNIVPKVVGITINFLRSAKPTESFASCKVIRQGKRIAHLQATCWQSDREKPVAVAYGNFKTGR